MKRMGCLTAVLVLVSMFFGCYDGSSVSEESGKGPSKAAPKITVIDEREKSSAEDLVNDLDALDRKPRKATGTCSTDDDCAAIPYPKREECVPCEGNAQAVTRGEARKEMEGLKDTCMNKFKDKEPFCEQYKSAVCQEGACVLVDISKEELQKRGEAMKKKWEGQQGASGHPKHGQGMSGQPMRGQKGGGETYNIAERTFGQSPFGQGSFGQGPLGQGQNPFGQGQNPFGSNAPMFDQGYAPTGGFQGMRGATPNQGFGGFGRENSWASPDGYDRSAHSFNRHPQNQWSNQSSFNGDSSFLGGNWGRGSGIQSVSEWEGQQPRFGRKPGSQQSWR
jgi:hypothetical protein